jgi:glycosyltransferase involved in cell wall biosynthesis
MASVLLVGTFLSGSIGTRGVCEELADRLAAVGWNILTTSTKPGRAARLADMLATVWRRRAEYDAAHIDVYSAAAFFWAEAVAFALRRLGKPYVLTLHGGALPDFARRWPGRTRRLLESAIAVTAPSGFLVEEMRRYRSDLRLIPNAIDVARYPFRLRDTARPRLVWLRAFHQIYDPSLAIRAFAILRRHFPDATLDMIGPDKKDGSFERAQAVAAELQVPVAFQGRVPKSDIPNWIDRGDIFLNTTTIDNTPVTVVEAMACGACVVSTNVGGVPHLIDNNVEGLLVDPGNPEAMAAAIARILTDRALAATLSRNARAKAEALDWSAILPQWISLFSALSACSALSQRLGVSAVNTQL